ncbi:MAG: hypothetical protein AAFR17_10865 [Pseudomonadota bacterium]
MRSPLLAVAVLIAFGASASSAGDRGLALDRLEQEAARSGKDTASLNRVERRLRLLRAKEAPFLGEAGGRSALVLDRLERQLRQRRRTSGAAAPFNRPPRRTRIIDKSLPEVSLGLEALEALPDDRE